MLWRRSAWSSIRGARERHRHHRRRVVCVLDRVVENEQSNIRSWNFFRVEVNDTKGKGKIACADENLLSSVMACMQHITT
jgi:hypothetical protein